MSVNNVFARGAYSSPRPLNGNTAPGKYQLGSNNEQTFSGHDLQVYFNDLRVGNMEAISWTVSTETVGNYIMGQRDPAAFTQGKRAIVGSIIMQQYAKDALLYEVFQLNLRKINTLGDLWAQDVVASQIAANQQSTSLVSAAVAGATVANGLGYSATFNTNTLATNNTLAGRGLNQAQLDAQLASQIAETVNIVQNEKVIYPDQLPPFDITLVGVNKAGYAAKCSIFGVEITQSTGSFNQNDMGSSVGMTFVCRMITPWTQIVINGGNTPPIQNIRA